MSEWKFSPLEREENRPNFERNTGERQGRRNVRIGFDPKYSLLLCSSSVKGYLGIGSVPWFLPSESP